jgi:hypothetical protein
LLPLFWMAMTWFVGSTSLWLKIKNKNWIRHKKGNYISNFPKTEKIFIREEN